MAIAYMKARATFESWKAELCVFSCITFMSSQYSAFAYINDLDSYIFSPCSVLCASNIVGLFYFVVFWGWQGELKLKDIQTIELEQWVALTISSILYVVAPLLLFMGIEHSFIPIVAIVQRLESLNILVLSFLFLKFRMKWWTFWNGLLTLSGIVLSILSPLFLPAPYNELTISRGLAYVVVAGWCYSSSSVITMKFLRGIPVSILFLYRTIIGTVVYHVAVFGMGRLHLGLHPGELRNPRLWVVMIPYSFLYVFVVQSLLLYSLTLGQYEESFTHALLLFICSFLFYCHPLSNFSNFNLAHPTSISVGFNALFPLSLCWSAGRSIKWMLM